MIFSFPGTLLPSIGLIGGLMFLPACAECAESTPVTEYPPALVIDTAPHPVFSADAVAPNANDTPLPTPPDHGSWDRLLQEYVSASGRVDYAGLRRNRGRLKDYLATLARATPDEDWSREAAMAYWINAYNAFTIELILDHWPVGSIKEIGNGNPWDDKWIELAGRRYSLNQIENEILRPRFRDPLIHFAVNCAAISCPPLHNRAFTAANLDRTLEQRTRAFINNERFNSLSPTAATVSKLFDWYRTDFAPLHEFLARYTTESIDARTNIRFREYDWGLNN
jgi:hypothetical protein